MTKITKENITIDYVIRATWISIQKMYNEEASTFDSTMSGAFALLSVDPKKGTPSSSLGPKMGIAATSLSRVLNELEKSNLIKRTSSLEDKRSIIISLTKKGLKMRDISKEYVKDFHNTIEEEIPKEKLDTFYEVINKINEIIIEKRKKKK
ncbi:MAG: MarR family transcriptional regulator [Flavobacteriaceae bacterium]|jgi:DNA-binding MarR family transcriptional regulator|nr:MarR family transcriptional regulator [Flavobacteriaceae bacterium]